MPSKDYTYFTLQEAQDHYNKKMAALEIVMTKFPDAKLMSYDHMPGGGELATANYFSPSIIHDDVKLRFSGTWYNLSVRPYVELHHKYGDIQVYNDPDSLNPFIVDWHYSSSIDTKDNVACWNNLEKTMSTMGYNEKLLKPIYKKILELFKNKDDDVKLYKDGLPPYIKDKLVFM
jgi:hypothetical protein